MTRATILVAALLVAAAVAPAPASAQSDDDFWGNLGDGEDDGSLAVAAAEKIAATTSFMARQAATLGEFFGEDESGSASEYATDFQRTFNSNNGTLESYVNQRVTADTGHDVYRVYFNDKEGGNVTRYVVSTVENGNFTNARMVNQTTFDSLNRSVDYTVRADWYVSRNAADELDAFITEYAEPNKDLTSSYVAKKKAKYGSGLESGLWGGS